jgi:hypothetical protein
MNFDRRDPCHRLASPRDACGLAGSRALEQLAQMRLGVGEIDALHRRLLTIYLIPYGAIWRTGQADGNSASPIECPIRNYDFPYWTFGG